MEQIDFLIFKLRLQIYAILNSQFKTNFRNLRVAFCLPIDKPYCRLSLLIPNFEAARAKYIMGKSISTIVKSNVGDWFSNIYLNCLD